MSICFWPQRSGRRHLRTVLASDQLEVEPARLTVAGRDHCEGPTPHRIATAVEAKRVHLLRRSVTADAVLP